MVFKLPFQNAQKKVDNFVDISFPQFQQLSSPSLHYPGFPVQTNCRHPPFNHTFARKCRSSWCLWMVGKNIERKKKCLCTIQIKEINISISFAMPFLSRDLLCGGKDWSGLKKSLWNHPSSRTHRFCLHLIKVPEGEAWKTAKTSI